MGTKGTWRRAAQISEAELDARWAAAFGPKCSGLRCAAGGDCPKCDPDGPEVAESPEPR